MTYKIVVKDNIYVSPDPSGRFYTRRQVHARMQRCHNGAARPLALNAVSVQDDIAEFVSAITNDVPTTEWEYVPIDLSKNIDHYIYGSEKSSK